MMKYLLTAISFLIFCDPAWAITNESLLRDCKIFANNNFELENLDTEDIHSSITCGFYIRSAVDEGVYACQMAKRFLQYSREEQNQKRADILLSGGMGIAELGTGTTPDNLRAVIQNFINYVEKNPKEWQYVPDAKDWLYKDWPCDLD